MKQKASPRQMTDSKSTNIKKQTNEQTNRQNKNKNKNKNTQTEYMHTHTHTNKTKKTEK